MKRAVAILSLAALAACSGPSRVTPTAFLPLEAPRSTAHYRVLYNMSGRLGGGILWGGVAVDANGNVFGAAMQGGKTCPLPSTQPGCGVVFELERAGSEYRERILHLFVGPTDGVYPEASPTLLANGALVGTTIVGGTRKCRTCGTAYELMPHAGGGYSERVIHYFGHVGGSNPRYAPLTAAKNGVLYGVTPVGGPNRCGCGTVFALVPVASGYRVDVLHAFNGSDGAEPLGPLTIAGDGTLYGTAAAGGKTTCSVSGSGTGCGVIFSIARTASGYRERIVHAFAGPDGADPDGTLTVAANGAIYGTAEAGGGTGCRNHGCGIAYELVASSDAYSETILHRFRGGSDASIPRGGMVAGPNGSFYTFTDGGGHGGAIVALLPSNGKYVDRVVHVFGTGNDGSAPEAPLAVGADGTLYGTTLLGGKYGVGTVFAYTPR